MTVFADDRTWGTGAVAVAGSLAAVAGWLTGRIPGTGLEADGGLPALPAWL
jgi:maleylpyruvate isomerase